MNNEKATPTDGNNFANEHVKDNNILVYLTNEANEVLKQHGLFELETANEAIESALAMPDPVYLYDCLVQERELIILFADTGIGKTVLAVQMAIHIASAGYKVLYLDLELSKKQFQRRYTGEDGKPYVMPDTLYRVGYSRLTSSNSSLDYTAFFLHSLESLIKETGASVVFLDNMTKLSAGSTDNAKDTIPVLNGLNDLHRRYGLTTIVLEHNKKVDPTRPIHLNDLQGSKMKSNLCDSVFTIGRSSTDKQLRYIKQVKVRDGELRYDTDNVAVFQIVKNDFLKFDLIGYSSESEHLRQQSETEKSNKIEQAKEMQSQGYTQRQISASLGVSLGAVNKYLKS